MDGMKSGAGDDPFADEVDDPDGEQAADDEPVAETAADPFDADGAASADETATDDTAQGSSLPWRFARDSAKDERDMVQFFLQDETQRLEGRAQAELAERLNDDVLVLDVREAAYTVALERHLDSVERKLREWGYDPD
jgi:hypothetical protein